MKVDKPSGRTTGVAATRRVSPAKTSERASNAARQVTDSVSIMGIPEAEMTVKVRDAIMTLIKEVETLRKDLDNTRARLNDLDRLAHEDTLVPAANRRAFVRELSRMISFAERYGTNSSLAFFDLNDFKALNDTHGHAAGDAALVHVTNLLLENIRESDIVGRLGGDEFGVILVGAEEDIAHDKTESLAELIQNTPIKWENESLRVGVSYGVYTFKKGVDALEALAHADKAMYAHKKTLKQTS